MNAGTRINVSDTRKLSTNQIASQSVHSSHVAEWDKKNSLPSQHPSYSFSQNRTNIPFYLNHNAIIWILEQANIPHVFNNFLCTVFVRYIKFKVPCCPSVSLQFLYHDFRNWLQPITFLTPWLVIAPDKNGWDIWTVMLSLRNPFVSGILEALWTENWEEDETCVGIGVRQWSQPFKIDVSWGVPKFYENVFSFILRLIIKVLKEWRDIASW